MVIERANDRVGNYNRAMSHLELVSLIVPDYDPAIAFFVDLLGFELVEDVPAISTTTGAVKRWVVVRPRNARTGILARPRRRTGPNRSGRPPGCRASRVLPARR